MKLRNDLSNLNEVLADFDERLEFAEADIKLGGKNLEKAIIEHPSYFAYYDQVKAELECLYNRADLFANIAQAKSIDVITLNKERIIGERNTEKMSKKDPDYARYSLARAELEERLTKAKAIMNSFEQRGYALGNIVRLRVALLKDITLGDIDDK